MFVLDTNHLREFALDTPMGARLKSRMQASRADFVVPIVAAEEGMRGWLARVASAKTRAQQIWAYSQLELLIHVLSQFVRLPWDGEASARFEHFRSRGVRIGTLDLRIACITIEHDATLLTRNTVDFAKVSGLRFEDWLD